MGERQIHPRKQREDYKPSRCGITVFKKAKDGEQYHTTIGWVYTNSGYPGAIHRAKSIIHELTKIPKKEMITSYNHDGIGGDVPTVQFSPKYKGMIDIHLGSNIEIVGKDTESKERFQIKQERGPA